MAKLDTTNIEKELIDFLDGKDLNIRCDPDLEKKMYDTSFMVQSDIDVFKQHGGIVKDNAIIVPIHDTKTKNSLLYTAQDLCSTHINEKIINGETYILCHVPILFKLT